MNRKISRLYTYICMAAALMLICCGCKIKRPEPVSNDEYTEIKGSRLYNTDSVTQEDIDALLDYLDFDDSSLFNDYVKLDKSDSDEYYVYFYVSEYEFDDETQLTFYQNAANDISLLVFYPNNVTVYLCNNKFEPQKTFVSEYNNNNTADTSDDTVN